MHLVRPLVSYFVRYRMVRSCVYFFIALVFDLWISLCI